MADWTKITGRGNVEDRRGQPMAFAGGGLGLLGIGILLLFSILSGSSVDINDVLQQLPQSNATSSYNAQDFEGEDNYEVFSSKVLGSNNELWRNTLAKNDLPYADPKLVLFRTATRSACGTATSNVGPHYCPLDSTIYIDETFYDELTSKLGAKGGDVAEAYVLSHEVGHHVQHQLGLINENTASSPEDSVRLELQADCFAGVWANSVNKLGIFESGEINEPINAAAAVGDDRIQSKVNGQVNPETWTHGSSEQRVAWFNRGYQTGSPAQCDTF